ncbi:hypothetical protein FA15DRAFT_702918 [Coprinopsis marcescibilis]|uniref:Uncharacterized protein n=1 Tax=Coprinopsis marcescibilis TaxID=230819 RepID=A0A5C3L168_COPMA|nr:hypothetical protein FA15DRAFT_702918 [Coprinopsis marcescibilis]
MSNCGSTRLLCGSVWLQPLGTGKLLATEFLTYLKYFFPTTTIQTMQTTNNLNHIKYSLHGPPLGPISQSTVSKSEAKRLKRSHSIEIIEDDRQVQEYFKNKENQSPGPSQSMNIPLKVSKRKRCKTCVSLKVELSRALKELQETRQELQDRMSDFKDMEQALFENDIEWPVEF